jgi:hypothetical protein
MRGHPRARALARGLLDQGDVGARLGDAGGHQEGGAACPGQARLDAEVEDDVVHHPLHARAGAEPVLHRAPGRLPLVLLPVVPPRGLGLEPGVDPVFGAEALVDVARFIDEIEHDAVLDALAELGGVHEAAADLQAGHPVFREQRRVREADAHRTRPQRLHHAVQPAALRSDFFRAMR